MRLVGLVAVAAGAALLAGSAVADPVPIPPVTVPTVTVPAVTVPAVPTPPASVPSPAPTVPQVPTPVAAASAAVQSTSSSLSQAAGTTSGSSAAAGQSSSGSVSGSGSGSGSGSASPSASGSARAVDHFHSSRPWIGTSGPKRRRTTTLTFVLQHPGRVIFTVSQVSPACVGMGWFSVAGHAGLNRVRFGGVIQGHRLGPGTYRISIRTAAGRVVRRVTLVVVEGSAPSRAELEARRASNTCRGTTGTTSNAMVGAAAAGPLGPQKLPQPQAAAAGLATPHAPNLRSGVLASSVEKTARAIQSLLVGLLALSILLLGLASLPREAVPGPRMYDALARHRVELAGLGAGVLVAVAVVLLLS